MIDQSVSADYTPRLMNTAPISVIYARNSRSVFSAVIRLFTGMARWSHCGIIDGDEVVEATARHGVVATPIDEFKARYTETEVVTYEVPNPENGMKFARDQKGKRYDWLGAVGVPFRLSFRKPWYDISKWFCNHLVEATLLAAGRQRWRFTKKSVSPMETYLVL
jgi:hypothetical protein